jgi:hypothetical protein
MGATAGVWDRVVLDGRAVTGQPMRAVLGRTRDEAFHRCLMRLRGAGAVLEIQPGSGTTLGTDLLLLGAPSHTLTASASLQADGARTAPRPSSPPGLPLRVVAIWRGAGGTLEMNSWLEAAQAGAVPMWQQLLFTNDIIKHSVVTGVGAGITIRLHRDAMGPRCTLAG